MAIKLAVPPLSDKEIRAHATEFLAQFNPQGKIPVPIEEIAEIDLRLNIIPMPRLRRLIGVDGFIYSDFSAIAVDESILEKFTNRYRFTLAHEIGHLYLHKDIFQEVKLTSIEEWKRFQAEVNPHDYDVAESQAYFFAGLVLVPSDDFSKQFDAHNRQAEKEGFTPLSESALYYVAEMLARTFEVSHTVAEKRMYEDRLWKR